jgi:hypothetical protein
LRIGYWAKYLILPNINKNGQQTKKQVAAYSWAGRNHLSSVDRCSGRGLLLEQQGQTVASRPAFTHAGHVEEEGFHIRNFLDKLHNILANYML